MKTYTHMELIDRRKDVEALSALIEGDRSVENTGKIGCSDGRGVTENCTEVHSITQEEDLSGRPDLNRGPPAPKAGALTKLRYAPLSFNEL